MKIKLSFTVVLWLFVIFGTTFQGRAQGTAFTYQGRLLNSGSPANGSYDIQFSLYATNTTGTAIAGPVTNTAVAVTNGLFTTMVDFGNVYNTASNWLQVAVSTNGVNAFSILSPRQQLTPAPYAITAASVSGNVAAAQLTGTVPNSVLAGFQGNDSAIGGGQGNSINGLESVVAGGFYNTNNANQSAIGGGAGNVIQTGAYYSIIGSGGGNVIQANSYDSAIASGYHNLVQSNSVVSSIGGGQFNTISTNTSFATIGGGYANTNAGSYATIPGGYQNLASGSYSLAAGHLAQATNQGAFVWADSQNTPFASTNNDSFNVRAQGGVQFATSGTGVQVDGTAVLTAAPGVIKGYEIDDGGSAAYQAFQSTLQAVGGDTTVGFSSLSSVTATNGTAPTLTLTINGAAFGTVIGFSGYEGMSQPYAYVVEVTNAMSLASSLNSEIGTTGVLTYTRNGRSTTFSGIVTLCAQASPAASSYLYTVQISSPLYTLGLTTDYRVFQNLTAPDVASDLCTEEGVAAPTRSLTGTSTIHTSLTQYGETALNFFNHILETEGIFYFFNQNGSIPKLVLGDNTGAYLAAANSPFAYYGNSGTNATPGEEFIRTFQQTFYQTTQKSTVNASDFINPDLNLLASDTGVAPNVGEYYEFGNAVETLAYDQQLATVRQGLHTNAQNLIAGSSTAPDLRAGYTFTLTDQTGTGQGGNYVVTAVHHAGFVRVTNGVSTFFYANQFQVLPASLTYRPPLKTPKPRALPSTATVTGTTGQEINVDKYGRINVLFHWDRHGNSAGTSSAWIPVASAWAGSGRGLYFWPRVGDEVMVSFLDGDPDRPVISGSLYNSGAMPPYTLPGNATYSGLRTLSSPGGTGYNELRFGDSTGAELIYLHAQKDFGWDVLHDLTLTVGNNMTVNDIGNMSLSGAAISLNSATISANGNLSVGGTLSGDGSGLTSLPGFAALLNANQTFTGSNSFATNVSVVGAQAGGFGTPLVLMQNTNGTLFTAPTLRTVGYGNSINGVLSVSSQGTGLIAQFGNASNFVADIQNNGTVDTGGLRVGNTGTTYSTIQSGQTIMPSSITVVTNFTVTFPQPFSSVPKVIATISGDPTYPTASDTFAMSIRAITNTTSFTVNVIRMDQSTGWSQQLRINWQAWQ